MPSPRRHPREGFNESIIGTGCFFFGEAKHSPVDVRQDEADRIDNQIDVFAKTFLGLTVSCARCHDHKFDAISTKDYYALAGYLQSSRYQQAFIDAPEPLAATIASLKAIGDERRRLCVDFVRSELAPRLAQLAETMLAGGQPGSTDAWARYLNDAALTHPDDVLHPWAVLTHKQPAGAPDDFSARRAKLAEQLKADLARDAAGASMLVADFAPPGYGDWQASGAAFGDRPGGSLEWTFVGPHDRFPAGVLSAGAAHSGLISTKLRGVLRSPTFEIVKPRLFYRLYGNGGRVRLIVDGLQLIQNPIYGGLQFEPGDLRAHWHEQDVSKWVGHRAYIEVIDDGDGFIALEKAVFSDGPPPAAMPNRLVAAMLDDPALTTPRRLAEKYQALFQQVFASWLAEPLGRSADAADRASIIGWVLDGHASTPELLKTRIGDLQPRLAALDERQQQLGSQIAAPRQAMALADGTAENEHVFIRGSHKTLGDEVPRRFLEVLGGTGHAPPEHGSGRLELARQMVSPANPLLPRVMVNRLWHHHFGAGIVRTVDDFGVMGQPPTHPELLDFLAAELVRQRLVAQGDASDACAVEHVSHVEPFAERRRSARSAKPSVAPDDCAAAGGRVDPRRPAGRLRPGRPNDVWPQRDAVFDVLYERSRAAEGFGSVGRRRPAEHLPGGAAEFPPADVPGVRLSDAVHHDRPPRLVERAGPGTGDDEQPAGHRAIAAVGPARAEPARPHAGTSGARNVFDSLGPAPDDAEERAVLAFVNETDGAIASTAAGAGDAARQQVWAELAHVLFNLKEFIFIP